MTQRAPIWWVELPDDPARAQARRTTAKAAAERTGVQPTFVQHDGEMWRDITEAPGSAAPLPARLDPGHVTLTAADASLPPRALTPLLVGEARPEVALPSCSDEAVYGETGEVSWTVATPIAHSLLATSRTFADLTTALLSPERRIAWGTAGSNAHTERPAPGRVLAVVPYFACAPWLGACLHALSTQTHPPDVIVVACDSDDRPPDAIVDAWPDVTFAACPQQVGPYALLQGVVDRVEARWVLVQDADDWSSADRIERQLRAAAATGAEMIGTADLRIEDQTPRLAPAAYPAQTSVAARRSYGHLYLYGSSLISRDLIQRLGGFSTGLRFGADTEFVRRASLAATVISLDAACYYRRLRAASLTRAPDTGIGSEARNEVIARIMKRARSNARRSAWRLRPDLRPLEVRPRAELEHFAGPRAWT